MSICEKPGWQLNRPCNINRLITHCINKKKILLLLIACLPIVQLNAQSSIYKYGWINFNKKGIYEFNHTRAILLPAPINIGSTCNRNLIFQAGYIIEKGARLLWYANIYAPILSITPGPRRGRILVCDSENPCLIAALGKQWLMGSGGKYQG